jgi:Mn2+/Fe2+ NRAMP family transporter
MRWLRAVFGFLVALVILFEEWGWEPLQAGMARLVLALRLDRLERRIARLPPHVALVVTFAPMLLAIPVKLAAVWLIARGQALLGLLMIIGVKVVGTAVLARLFALTRPTLMQLPWFARLHGRWTAWKATLMVWLRATPAWRWSRMLVERLRRAP